MKFNLNKGIATLTSETQKEAFQLFQLALGTSDILGAKAMKPHKKHNFVKKCEYCGKGFKGNVGLGIHKAKCKKKVIKADTFNEIWK